VDNSLNTFNGTTTFGIHAGAGVNVPVSQNVFIGVEGRYVWAEPSFGDQTITLNDEDYELNGFKLNGFTTTLVLGYSF
jgi:opacity protein-like surface antigen